MKVVTYLINLDGSHERLECAKQQLNDIDWVFEKFSAFDGRGKALSSFENYDDQQAKKLMGRSLLSSEIGCYLSHYNCALKFLESDADYLIVLEDDMQLSTNFKKTILPLLDYLFSNRHLEWSLVNIAANKKKLARDIIEINNHTLWHAYYFPVLGLGLVWSRKGAEEFIEKGKIITMPVDVFFQRWLSGNGNGLGVWPSLVKPMGLDSDILGTVASQNIKRKDRENRDSTYSFKKQKRMLQDKLSAIKNLITTK